MEKERGQYGIFLWWHFNQHLQCLSFLGSLAIFSTLLTIFEMLDSIIVYIYVSKNRRSMIMALHLIDGFSNSKNHLEETILWPLLDISLNLCFIHLLFISCISDSVLESASWLIPVLPRFTSEFLAAWYQERAKSSLVGIVYHCISLCLEQTDNQLILLTGGVNESMTSWLCSLRQCTTHQLINTFRAPWVGIVYAHFVHKTKPKKGKKQKFQVKALSYIWVLIKLQKLFLWLNSALSCRGVSGIVYLYPTGIKLSFFDLFFCLHAFFKEKQHCWKIAHTPYNSPTSRYEEQQEFIDRGGKRLLWTNFIWEAKGMGQGEGCWLTEYLFCTGVCEIPNRKLWLGNFTFCTEKSDKSI